MKFLSVALLALSGTAIVEAQPAASCVEQSNCITFTITESNTGICTRRGEACEYEVCIKRDDNGGRCLKSNHDTFSHACEKDDLTCAADPPDGFASADEIQGIDYTREGCQIAGPEQQVEFLLKDGAGCGSPGNYNIEATIFGDASVVNAGCQPRPESIPSCTGNGAGIECVWTVTTPACSNDATTTAIPPPVTTDAPPVTTDAPPTATRAPPATTDAPPTVGANGDPHVKTWDGSSFDFHGGCDLVLVKNAGFDNGNGLDIHIRTKIRTWWSFIETAVLRIGSNTLEVKGGMNAASYWINGELAEHREFVQGDGSYNEIGSISGFKLEYKDVSDRQRNFRVQLGDDSTISLQAFREFMRVDIKSNSTNFAGAVGLMGEYPSGRKADREGNVVDNTDEFGKEWQVRRTEVQLFHAVEGVQHPEECQMPVESSTTARTGRRLGEGMITEEEAAVACAHAHVTERDNCIFDVLAVNSKELAGAY